VNANTIRKFRWFWAWNDDKEEAWLRQMSQEGWHLRSFGLPGFYIFEAGSPRDYVYRLDFQTTSKKDTAAYLQLFADAGWEYLGSMGNWHYFRKEAPSGEMPEIFTDNNSKVQKYRRLIAFLLALSPVFFALMINLGEAESEIYQIFDLLAAIFVTLYAYAILRLALRIRQLRKL
jgi:hypothetical protein